MTIIKTSTCGRPIEEIITERRQQRKDPKTAQRPLSQRIIKFVKRSLYGPSKTPQWKSEQQLESYGGDRRWIRVVAMNPAN